MTNPNNAVGTNAAYGGRTSVNAFNDDLAVYSRGIMSGWACSPNSGLTVSLGGDGTTRDVAVAEDNSGNKVTINNISGSPVNVTLSAAPGSNSRIDAIVAYVDNPPQGSSTIADNYEACGLIAVSGTVSSSPVPPTDSAIRSAITADGASGATAYYVILATVNIASGTTDIVEADITSGSSAQVQNNNLPEIEAEKLPATTADKIDFSSFGVSDLNFGHYINRSIGLGYSVSANLTRIGNIVIVQGSLIISGTLPATETVLSEKMPVGYRPRISVSINALCGSETGKYASWYVNTAGSMSMIATGFTTAAQRRLNVLGVWITQDAWPSS